LKEPPVDPGQSVDLFHRVAGLHGIANHKDPHVGRLVQRFVDILYNQFPVLNETVHSLAYHAQSLLYGFFKSASDRHHFPDRFHAAANLPGNTPELAKVPAWDLADHIIQCRFKKSRSDPGNGIFQLVQPVSQGQLGSHKSQRISGCL